MVAVLNLTNIGRNNDEVFSDVEVQIIRQHIADAKAELNWLLDRKRQIMDSLNRYQIAIAPHKKLSSDISSISSPT